MGQEQVRDALGSGAAPDAADIMGALPAYERCGVALKTGNPVLVAPPPSRKATPVVLAGVTLWRLTIVGFALIGLTAVPGGGFDQLQYLSQLASLVAAVAYLGLLLYPLATGLARHEPVSPWLRGSTTVLLALVAFTFLCLMNADLSSTASLFEHLLTPLAVLVDWLLVGRDQRNARWWYPITWLAMPLAYLAFYIWYVGDGVPLYSFLDPAAGDFAQVVAAFLAGVLAFGYVVYGIGKARSLPRS